EVVSTATPPEKARQDPQVLTRSASRPRPCRKNIADGETGVNPQNTRHFRQDLLMDPLELARIADFDAQQIVSASGHQKALLDFRMLPHGRLEPVQIFFCLPFKCDVDDDGN